MRITTPLLAAVTIAGVLAATPASGTPTGTQGHETEFGQSSNGSVTVFDGDGIRKVVHRNHQNGKKFVEYPGNACKKSFTVRKHFKSLGTERAVAVDCDGNRIKFKLT